MILTEELKGTGGGWGEGCRAVVDLEVGLKRETEQEYNMQTITTVQQGAGEGRKTRGEKFG